MAYEQVDAILDHIGAYHRRAAEEYRDLSAQVGRERLAMLLDYLARHESMLADTVGRYRDEASPRVLSTWITTAADTHRLLELCPSVHAEQAKLEVDDLLDLALRRDTRILQTYEDLTDSSAPQWIAEAFEGLLEMERHHQQRMATQTARLNEL